MFCKHAAISFVLMLKSEDHCYCVMKQRWFLSYCYLLDSSFICTIELKDPNLDGEKVRT